MSKQFENKPQETKISISQQQIFVGPVPSPEVLEKYNQVHPGFAERLIAMAEKEQQNRFDLKAKEQQFNNREINLAFLALALAIISVVIVVGLCAYGFHLGYPTEVKWIAVGVISSTVIAFLSTRFFQSKK